MMFNSVLCHIPVNELHTRKSGMSCAYNITGGDYNYFGIGPDLEGMKDYTSSEEYSITNLCEQKAAWNIIDSLNNANKLLKKPEERGTFFANTCAPYLKTVEDVAALNDKARALWNTLPTSLKPGYLTATASDETTQFCWNYDEKKNCFWPCATYRIPEGAYTIEDGAIRGNSCIAATDLLRWMITVEENTIRDINKTAQLIGKFFPATDGWTISFLPECMNNNLFQRVVVSEDGPFKATTRITVIGTKTEIEQLESFLQERNLPTDFKKRVVAESVVEEAAAQEQLGALFSGAAKQDKKPYGIFMLPAWLSITGCTYEAVSSWIQMKHWTRLPVSSAVDLTAQYLKILKSVKCYVAAPSQSGGYLVATSAGFFFVDDMQKPSIVQYRTLEQLNQMEGFSDYSKFSVAKELDKACDVQTFRLSDEQKYLCQLRAYYLSKHPLSDYGEIVKFLKGVPIKGSKLLELLWTYNMPGSFMPIAAFKGTEWGVDNMCSSLGEKTIACYLQNVMYKMLASDQAMFFKDGKFVNGREETYSEYMTSIKGELKDLFCLLEERERLVKGGYRERKHNDKTLEVSGHWWSGGMVAFAIPRSF